MNRRNLSDVLLEALSDTPVVFLRGARQSGKTTLVKNFAPDGAGARNYVTLDSATALAAALRDPAGFLHGLRKPLTIDEAQRAPELMLAIKEDIDRERLAGRYLLTGSANVMALPKVADSLAGRMEILTLYPLSRGEIVGAREDFIARLFDRSHVFTGNAPQYTQEDLLEIICSGGYPEVLTRKSEKRRTAWFESYITALAERDIRDIANIQDRGGVIRLLGLLAARSASLFNQSEISKASAIPNSTLSRYISLLEATFIIYFLPPWSSNLGKRLIKSPKIHLVDSGLAAHLCGSDNGGLGRGLSLAGKLFESFVVGEILKQSGWTEHPVRLYHYRSRTGDEIDLLLEDRSGNIAAVEIKLSQTITNRDVKSVSGLRDALGGNFVRGAVIYSGREVFPLGDRLIALPAGAAIG
ncbi:MAG: ATP-binding protein [Synergistaceae bacterium]|jgi:predicted AAA+ superfamily ATPase|nr:ATP-binding protein [Synergistaceae bacterium]